MGARIVGSLIVVLVIFTPFVWIAIETGQYLQIALGVPLGVALASLGIGFCHAIGMIVRGKWPWQRDYW